MATLTVATTVITSRLDRVAGYTGNGMGSQRIGFIVTLVRLSVVMTASASCWFAWVMVTQGSGVRVVVGGFLKEHAVTASIVNRKRARRLWRKTLVVASTISRALANFQLPRTGSFVLACGNEVFARTQRFLCELLWPTFFPPQYSEPAKA